jgi:hypothetical protein
MLLEIGQQYDDNLTRESLSNLREKINNFRVKALNDLKYHSPVEKIGLNMQFIALFTQEHLSQIK